jgi:hypothetical protein
LQGAPSVQMQQVPPPFRTTPEEDDNGNEGDEKANSRKRVTKKQHSAEMYDNVD